MGCDIHLYQEYRKKSAEAKKQWSGLGGRINPGRNYYLFGLLSKGVRIDLKDAFEPRGLPEDIAYEAKDDSQLFITEEEGEGYATLEQAKEWEKRGNKITYHGDKPVFVENPDHHSHSWLTLDEFKKVMRLFRKECKKELYSGYFEVEYEAIQAALERLEELGQDTRVVFWFDN